MRFAEKMLLNAKFYGLVAGIRHDGQGNRCALGLVEERVTLCPTYGIPELGCWAEDLYPWLTQVRAVSNPCTHYFTDCHQVIPTIAHVFNEHVMGDETWTLEKLADWIESVDPSPRGVAVAVIEESVGSLAGVAP